MKLQTLFTLIFAAALFVGCKEEAETPKVIYEATQKETQEPEVIDSTQIEIADLPILMEGTKYLIHPIGDFRVYEGRSKSSYGSSNTEKVSFSISNYNRFEITGYLQNLKFQHIDSTEIRSLTDKKMVIQTASFLNTISEKSKLQYLIYTVSDIDTNKDGQVNASDIKSLYISNISGLNFKKISPTMEELIDWNLVEEKDRLYFRTIEDTNKNGLFDKNDQVLYYFLNLQNPALEIEKYTPIN